LPCLLFRCPASFDVCQLFCASAADAIHDAARFDYALPTLRAPLPFDIDDAPLSAANMSPPDISFRPKSHLLVHVHCAAVARYAQAFFVSRFSLFSFLHIFSFHIAAG